MFIYRIMCNYTLFKYAIHPLLHPDVYEPVNLFGGKLIFFDDLLGYDIDGYFEEILILRGVVKVEMIEFHYKVFCIGVW